MSDAGFQISAKLVGMEKANARLLDVMEKRGRDLLRKASQTNANEFAATIRRIVPQDDGDGAHLVDTVAQHSVGKLGIAVTIGNSLLRYPLHLETGHRLPDGTHVPGKPYWFPAIRVMRKKAAARTKRSYMAAIKSAFPPGSAGL